MNRSDAQPHPDEPFVSWKQQREAAQLGMWLFLASEVMMFGSLIMVAWFYRFEHPDGVGEAVSELHYLLAGGNTALLLTSSVCMSLALEAAGRVQLEKLRRYLLLSAALGLGFLGCKLLEYSLEFHEGLLPGFGLNSPLKLPSARLFMNLYFCATFLHGIHVLVAVGLALHLFVGLKRRWLELPQASVRVEMTTLYWHLVDAIWVLLYPSLYLIGR
ncbi:MULTISPECIES: cytochrome c oxidase subunit 3 [unclassified Pseudomonas]|uniref:cytochrome c oxidase subunit 3 n=1 Tax=unclassified Pseudomonas TaxID=196821 RepID=UPI002AC9109D|nr:MULTISPECIES: cytochrome c oxidase subunit 3 [unclassified Pseudomonas]MEB0040032.1 cytochrome c oxidase subunit 3 [Pseudomonas sp. MH10]MEB0119557.1 cytochrome c oxidase subunit 3 [Pseudomonas sp. CCI1.2]WPX65162.1 cytochrome c oxidase subunit 3 [Pseudomonas sp. MH10]